MDNKEAVGKRKKKGRPSLLDLQKRSLRIQNQQNPNPNPKPSNTPNPYLKFPNSTPTRRSTRRNPNPDANEEGEEDGEDEDGATNGKKRKKEKKLKLVVSIPNGSSDPDSCGSDLDANGEGSKKKRKIDSLEAERQNSSSKATDQTPLQVNPSDSGSTMPLPDKKLLVFILDRLQKKDTYGVFLEPVDPEELPDYHDIIEHPMDFTTVRSKLSDGAYACLEQFESDVYLISSNAMRYNAPDTIYYRQARSIQELAKKHFENIRQGSDNNEPEPQIARRGRPPIKNTIKRMLAKTPADHTNATLANSRNDTHSISTNDLMRKGSSFDKISILDSSTKASHALRYTDTPRNSGDPRSEYLGSSLRGFPMGNWKKQPVLDENRRDTYKQPLMSTFGQEPSVLSVFDSERKQLAPVGFHTEHSYARSLARFAANLGPVGWEIAAKKIQRALPPGTKFGRGWVGDNEAPRPQPLLSTSQHISTQAKLLHCSTPSGVSKPTDGHETPQIDSARPPPASGSPTPTLSRSSVIVDGAEARKNSKLQPCTNGFNSGFGVNMSVSHTRPPEELMPRACMLDAVCGNSENIFPNHEAPLSQVDAEEKSRLVVGNSSTTKHSGALLMNPKPGSFSPDLNADFQSLGSSASGILVDPQQKQKQQQPDLALQL